MEVWCGPTRAHFEVSVDNVLPVAVPHRLDKLLEESPCPFLSHATVFLKQVTKGTAVCVFHHYEYSFAVLANDDLM